MVIIVSRNENLNLFICVNMDYTKDFFFMDMEETFENCAWDNIILELVSLLFNRKNQQNAAAFISNKVSLKYVNEKERVQG